MVARARRALAPGLAVVAWACSEPGVVATNVREMRVHSFVASADTITAGQTVRLSWTSDAQEVDIYACVYPDPPQIDGCMILGYPMFERLGPRGHVRVAPTKSTAYTCRPVVPPWAGPGFTSVGIQLGVRVLAP